jgi:hypothetical protein
VVARDSRSHDVIAVTATGKGQLFHYFPGGREELLLAVADYESERVLLDQQPYLGQLDSWAAWRSWRDTLVQRYRRQEAALDTVPRSRRWSRR